MSLCLCIKENNFPMNTFIHSVILCHFIVWTSVVFSALPLASSMVETKSPNSSHLKRKVQRTASHSSSTSFSTLDAPISKCFFCVRVLSARCFLSAVCVKSFWDFVCVAWNRSKLMVFLLRHTVLFTIVRRLEMWKYVLCHAHNYTEPNTKYVYGVHVPDARYKHNEYVPRLFWRISFCRVHYEHFQFRFLLLFHMLECIEHGLFDESKANK